MMIYDKQMHLSSLGSAVSSSGTFSDASDAWPRRSDANKISDPHRECIEMSSTSRFDIFMTWNSTLMLLVELRLKNLLFWELLDTSFRGTDCQESDLESDSDLTL